MDLAVTTTLKLGWADQVVVDYCDAAQRRDSHAIGWLASSMILEQHRSAKIWICRRNGDDVGYLLARSNRLREHRVIQAWVRPDARMVEHGRALVAAFREAAVAERGDQCRLYCADDLAANEFWRVLGWTRRSWRYGAKDRRLWLYTLPVIGGIADGRQEDARGCGPAVHADAADQG